MQGLRSKTKSAILGAFVAAGGTLPFRYLNRGKARILTYHRFSERTHSHRVSAKQFERHLVYLKRHYHVISLDELVDRISDGSPMPENASVITIDDGYRDAYEVAYPLLRKYDVPATIYAITGFLDGECWLWTDIVRFLLEGKHGQDTEIDFDGFAETVRTEQEADRLAAADRINGRLKQMANEEKNSALEDIAFSFGVLVPDTPPKEYAAFSPENALEMDRNGVRIESHTRTHPILTQISAEELNEELATSKSRLEEMLQREIRHFCYPNGDYENETGAAVEALGYSSAVTSEFGLLAVNENKYFLRRLPIGPDFVDLVRHVSGFESFSMRLRNKNSMFGKLETNSRSGT